MAAELLSPTAASALTGTGGWTALVRVGGGAAATARTADDLPELAALRTQRWTTASRRLGAVASHFAPASPRAARERDAVPRWGGRRVAGSRACR